MASKGYQFKHTWNHMSIPSTWRKKDLNQKHDNKYVSHQEQNKIPHQTSNKDLYNTMHLKQRDKEVHDNTAYTSHQGVTKRRG